VPLGARCVTCNEKRRRVLKSVELLGGWKPMCFNCSGQILHLDPMPKTVGEMRDIISRERRKNDRRIGKPDTRVFRYERRVGDRRMPRDGDYPNIDDEMIIEVTDDASGGDDFDDLTQIRELVRDLRPADLAG
jgi:hypothetical protein